MITVSGIFNSFSGGQRAIEALRSIGIDERYIGLLSPGAEEEEVEGAVPVMEPHHRGTGERLGSAMGRGLGAFGGMMIGAAVGSFFVPGIGPIFIAGVLGAALVGTGGAALGAAAGEAVDDQITKHNWHEELHVYEDALRRGCTVVLALAGNEKKAEAVHEALAKAGALSFVEARESWWNGLRVTEQQEYAATGKDFASDEALFRKGFEAAQHPSWRGKSFAEAAPALRAQYGDDFERDAFRHGYERGLAHHQQVIGEYQNKTDQQTSD